LASLVGKREPGLPNHYIEGARLNLKNWGEGIAVDPKKKALTFGEKKHGQAGGVQRVKKKCTGEKTLS